MPSLEQQVHLVKQEADATVARINSAKAMLCPEAFAEFVKTVRAALPPVATASPKKAGKK